MPDIPEDLLSPRPQKESKPYRGCPHITVRDYLGLSHAEQMKLDRYFDEAHALERQHLRGAGAGQSYQVSYHAGQSGRY